jgi:hypothetical protein
MRKRLAAVLALSVLPTPVVYAADFDHDELCVYQKGPNGQPNKALPRIVSKKKLALAILSRMDLKTLAEQADDNPSSPQYGPFWRRIFLDPTFCQNDAACIGPHLPQPGEPKPVPGAKPPPEDNTAALEKVKQLRFEFVNSVITNMDGRYYALSNPGAGVDYFLGDDRINRITCVGPDVPTEPKAVKIKMPAGLRLRANADDLNVDKSNPVYADAFRSVKPATINFSRDIDKVNKASLQATLGYAIPLFSEPSPWGIFSGEVVPYIAASQSVTKTDGKAATYADTNNVAAGALLNTELLFKGTGLNNVFLIKPQYLWNTKDRSEIASVKFIYEPWTNGLLRINTPIQVGTFFEASWLQLLFDVRANIGEYAKKSTDPTVAVGQSSFERAGTKFGFSFSTNSKTAHAVLTVTETLLYGFAGPVKHLSFFDSTLSFYFDATSNFALTLSYTNGRDEDTAEDVRTYKAGLSAKF